MAMSPFWNRALPLAGAGLLMTAVVSVVNFQISMGTVEGYMRGWVERNGLGGSTNMTLGILLTNLLAYPALNAFTMVVALPFLLGFHPEWGRQPRQAAALILVPTLIVGALWWAGRRLFMIYTLPALVFMAVPAAILVWMGGRAE